MLCAGSCRGKGRRRKGRDKLNRKRQNSPKFEKEGGVKEEKAMGTGCGEKGEVEREKERGEGGGKHRRRCCWDLPHLNKPSSDLHFLFFFSYAFNMLYFLFLYSSPCIVVSSVLFSCISIFPSPSSSVWFGGPPIVIPHPAPANRPTCASFFLSPLTCPRQTTRLVSCAKALSTVVTQSKPWSRPPRGCAHHSIEVDHMARKLYNIVIVESK